MQRAVGRTISKVSETSLQLFSAMDRKTRAATYFGSEAKFDDYLLAGKIDKLPMANRELKDEVTRLVGQNNIDAARERYAFANVSNLQYSFGRANRPEKFRGALGNLNSMFLSYPLNTFEMVKMFGKRATPESWGVGGQGDWRPLARFFGINAFIAMAGSEMLNADLRSMTIWASMPSTMAIPKMGMDLWNTGKTNVEWATGSLFNIGETDFHKYKRSESQKALRRDAKMLVPGGLFMFDDFPRALDEGSLARWLALTPKAAAINEQNRINQRERMLEQGGMRMPTLRRLE
jgi:hypothetical protein